MEIERKFLISDFPKEESIVLEKEADIYQGYLTISPEVRVRSSCTGNLTDYKLTIKGDGTLSREEIEVSLNENQFNSIVNLTTFNFIHKVYKKYKLLNGLYLECSHVDPGLSTSFYYAEIEFSSEDQADAFSPFEYLEKEITNDPEWKMKNYWKRAHSY